MSRILVTVVGPGGPVDLVVPADQPVTALLDPLARAGGTAGRQGGAGGSNWSLALVGGDPLPPERSLATCGVADGAVLALVDGSRPTVSPSRLRPCAIVGVLSAAAGMGRTTVAALVSEALAAGPGGPTVAVDAHPGAGSLSERLAHGDAVDAGDLLALIDHPALTREELFACLPWSRSGLALLASRPSRGRGPPLTQRHWTRLVRGLATNGVTVVLDCGPGLGHPGARAALVSADQVVLVVEPSPSPASRPSPASERMAHTLANRGLPVTALPWPAQPPLHPPVPGPASPDGSPLAAVFAEVSGAGREQVARVADVLVADWTALGIGGARCGGGVGSLAVGSGGGG